MSLSFIFIPCGNFQHFWESEVVIFPPHTQIARKLFSSRMRKLDYDGRCGYEVWIRARLNEEKSNLNFGPKKSRTMMTHERERENKKGDKNNANYLLTVRASQGIIFWLLSRLSITALAWQESVKQTEHTRKKRIHEHFWSWILLEFVIWTESRLQ